MRLAARKLPPVILRGVLTSMLFTTLLPCEIVIVTPGGALMKTSFVGPGTWPEIQLLAPCHGPETWPIQVSPSLTVMIPASVMPDATGSRSALTPNSGGVVSRRTAARNRPKNVGTLLITKLPSPTVLTGSAPNPIRFTVTPATGVPEPSCTNPRTVVSGSPGETSIWHTLVAPSLTTVISAEPLPRAVTSPSPPTIAINGLLVR